MMSILCTEVPLHFSHFPSSPPPPHPSHPLSQVMSIMKQVVDDFIKEKGSEYDARKGPSAR